MAKITAIPTECPDCNGQVWDNTKGRGKRNPKGPDATCKDKEGCGWKGWLPDAPKAAGKASTANQAYAWGPLLKLCVKYVKKEIAPEFEKPTNELIKELATTLFITGSKERGEMWSLAPTTPVEPPPPPAPEPPSRPTPPVRRSDYDSDDLPF